MLIGKGGKIDELNKTQKVESRYVINQMSYKISFGSERYDKDIITKLYIQKNTLK